MPGGGHRPVRLRADDHVRVHAAGRRAAARAGRGRPPRQRPDGDRRVCGRRPGARRLHRLASRRRSRSPWPAPRAAALPVVDLPDANAIGTLDDAPSRSSTPRRSRSEGSASRWSARWPWRSRGVALATLTPEQLAALRPPQAKPARPRRRARSRADRRGQGREPQSNGAPATPDAAQDSKSRRRDACYQR